MRIGGQLLEKVTRIKAEMPRASDYPRLTILAVDPGPNESAMVIYDYGINLCIMEANDRLRDRLRYLAENMKIVGDSRLLAIEKIESYGMAVGAEVFATCIETGRFIEAWGGEFRLVPRREVKLHHCHSSRATDANIRQVLIDRYGGKDAAIGKKQSPGPLYAIKSHLWSALAIALTVSDEDTAS